MHLAKKLDKTAGNKACDEISPRDLIVSRLFIGVWGDDDLIVVYPLSKDFIPSTRPFAFNSLSLNIYCNTENTFLLFYQI